MRELVLQNSRLDGRYDVLNQLGRGSYAEVFTARDNLALPDSAHKLVVIKALNVFLQDDLDADLERTLIENFQNEAISLDRVRHPNIISRFGHGTARDLNGLVFHYLVLEYMAGGELSALCKGKPIPFSQAMNYLEQTCAGLAFAHRQNVIHRDIKPQNLLLTADKKILKIADFGVARTTLSDAPLTRVGTNIYAPPEHSPLGIISGAVNQTKTFRLTPAADIYSLAKTAYVMFSGESPRRFSNAPLTELPLSISREPWAGGILRVLQKATQNEPSVRQQTIADFWNDLANVKFSVETGDNAETPTQIKPRTFVPAPSNSKDFIAEPPALPKFEAEEDLIHVSEDAPERPRIVVQFGNKTIQQPAVPLNQPPLEIPPRPQIIEFPVNPPQSSPVATVSPVVMQNNPAVQTKKSSAKFLRGMIFLAVFLAGFAGILLATHNYLRSNGFLNTGTPPPSAVCASDKPIGCTATATTDLNLRPEPGTNNDPIGLATKDSRLKIVRVEGNWAEVVVLQYGKPKEKASDADQGWASRKFIDVQ